MMLHGETMSMAEIPPFQKYTKITFNMSMLLSRKLEIIYETLIELSYLLNFFVKFILNGNFGILGLLHGRSKRNRML